MKGIPNESVIERIASAIFKECSLDSMTQGPAIKGREPVPYSTLSTVTFLVIYFFSSSC